MTIEQLQAELATLLDQPGEWTQRQRDHRASLESQIAQLQRDAATVARAEQRVANIDGQINSLAKWRDFLNASRVAICEELSGVAGRTRAERETMGELELCIQSVDSGLKALSGASQYSLLHTRLGKMMIEAGFAPNPMMDQLAVYGYLPWQGSLGEVEQKLAMLQKQRDAADFDLQIARRDCEMATATAAVSS